MIMEFVHQGFLLLKGFYIYTPTNVGFLSLYVTIPLSIATKSSSKFFCDI